VAEAAALTPPPSFRSWREYVENSEFNPSRAALTDTEIETLAQLLNHRGDQVRALQDEAARHLGALIDIKIQNGDCQIVEQGTAITPEPGHMVGLNINHDGIRRVVRVYPGDYAPLDLAYSDMWSQYKLGEEDVKTFFAGR